MYQLMEAGWQGVVAGKGEGERNEACHFGQLDSLRTLHYYLNRM
jgi:hypothetical protein